MDPANGLRNKLTNRESEQAYTTDIPTYRELTCVKQTSREINIQTEPTSVQQTNREINIQPNRANECTTDK